MTESRGTVLEQGEQVPLLGYVGNFNIDNDGYASHIDKFGAGGLMSVADIAERNAIPNKRRVQGMLCYVAETDTYYKLEVDLSTWSISPMMAGYGPFQEIVSVGSINALGSVYNNIVPFVHIYSGSANMTIDRIQQPSINLRPLFAFWVTGTGNVTFQRNQGDDVEGGITYRQLKIQGQNSLELTEDDSFLWMIYDNVRNVWIVK